MTPTSPVAAPTGPPGPDGPDGPDGPAGGPAGRLRPDPVLAGPVALLAAVPLLVAAPVPLGVRAALWWAALAVAHAVLLRCAWRVRSDSAGRPGRRRLWSALAVAAGCYLVGDVVQLVALAVGPVTVALAAGGSARTALDVAGTGVVVATLLLMPVLTAGRRELARFWLDVGIVAAAAAAAGAYLMLPVEPAGVVAAVGALLTGPVLCAAAAFAVFKLVLARERPFGTRSGALLGAAAVLAAVLAAATPRLVADARVDIVLFGQLLTAVLLAVSARVEERDPVAPDRVHRPRRRLGAVLPYVALAAVQALLVRALAVEGLTGRVWLVLAGATAGTALVVVRQVDAVVETSRLLRDLDRRVEQLDGAVAERDRLAERLRHQAHHDALTGLGNRTLLAGLLAAPRPGAPLTLLLVDLDDFKPVNDRFGHAAGDLLLVQVADRLRTCARLHPAFRLGGDEFAVLVEGDRAEAERVAGCLVESLAWVYRLPAGPAMVGASVGGAIVPGPPFEADALLLAADTALYAVKRTGKGRYRLVEAAPTLDDHTL